MSGLAVLHLLLVLLCAVSVANAEKGYDRATPQPSSSASSTKLCKERNETAWTSFLSYSKANLREISSEQRFIYQTIESFGPTTLYTPCDGIPRLRFLGKPTASRTKNVTVIHSLKSLYVPGIEEEEKKVWNQVPCKTATTYSSHGGGFGGFSWSPQAMELGLDPRGDWPSDSPCPADMLEWYAVVANKKSNSTEELPSVPCKEWFDCGIKMHEEVLLIYWAPEPRILDACGSRISSHLFEEPTLGLSNATGLTTRTSATFVTSALTFKGRDFYTVGFIEKGVTHFQDISYISPEVLQGLFTFVSPTVYLAHKPIIATVERYLELKTWKGQENQRISTKMRSEMFPAGLLAIHSSDVSTLGGRPAPLLNDVEYAQHAAQGKISRYTPTRLGDRMDHSFVKPTLRPFNFQDLQYPLLASPWFDVRSDCWGYQTHCLTITEDNYRPEIRIHSTIWQSMIDRFSSHTRSGAQCRIPQLVDPPIILQPIDSKVLMEPSLSTMTGRLSSATPVSDYIFQGQPPAPGSRPNPPHAVFTQHAESGAPQRSSEYTGLQQDEYRNGREQAERKGRNKDQGGNHNEASSTENDLKSNNASPDHKSRLPSDSKNEMGNAKLEADTKYFTGEAKVWETSGTLLKMALLFSITFASF
jgi:hypothetical protein